MSALKELNFRFAINAQPWAGTLTQQLRVY
jgi:hypothetical protein